jgi:uncharacterized repeat protein (TIGR03803 family)
LRRCSWLGPRPSESGYLDSLKRGLSMRQKTFWIAASCVLVVIGMRPVFSSGAAPTSKEKVIYSFTGGADGGQPMSDLTIGADGNLYGTTQYGGGGECKYSSPGCGTVFELKRSGDGWTEQVLYSFTGIDNDGAIPEAGVIFDKAGNLYGTTAGGGGVYSDGTVFKLAPNSHGGWTESVIYNFSFYGSAGNEPHAGLAFDARGNLYGTTPQGGEDGEPCSPNGCGALFELTPQADGSWTETTIHIFQDGNDGANPSSGVILDSAGNVYGETLYGGTGPCQVGSYYGFTTGCGVIYEFVPGSGGNWKENVLYNFVRGGGFAVNPVGGLLFGEAGNLLGISLTGGDGYGTIFELYESQKHGWQQNCLHIFSGVPDGSVSWLAGFGGAGMLVRDAKGNLFGVTPFGGASQNGGSQAGIIFEMLHSKERSQERILHSFDGTADGANPQSGLVFDVKGRLYGTTQYGGGRGNCLYGNRNIGCGTVYEITP